MVAPKAGTRSRRYCGTIHFPTDHTQWADAAHCINTDPFTRFFICQPETCPGTNKLHVQFYIEFISPKTMSSAKSIVGQGKASPHMEICLGSAEQNITYCTKEESNVRAQFPELSLTYNLCCYRCPPTLEHNLAAGAARFTFRRIIRSGPTPRTASILIRSPAFSFASQNSVLTLVNFTFSSKWSFSRPKL